MASGWNLWVWLAGGGCITIQASGITIQYTVLLYCTLYYYTVHCITIQYTVLLYSTLYYYTVRRWVCLESIGVVSGCFPHITYISLLLLYL